jgi:GTP-binding protein
MANYLQTRRNLTGIVLLCDPRLGLTELDEVLLDVVRPRVVEGLKFLVLLTKSDKLNRTESNAALASCKIFLAGIATAESDVTVMLFSALKKLGVGEVACILHSWVHPEGKPAPP